MEKTNSQNDYQVEGGRFTRIINVVIDELVFAPLLASEIKTCLFVIRKTWGFNKTTDKISLTQFEKATGQSRPTVIKALKNLQLVNILLLVKKGKSPLEGNEWKINKYTKTWKLVKTPLLVKSSNTTSKLTFTNTSKDTFTHKRHIKDNIQKTIEPIGSKTNSFLKLFEKVNPSYERLFANKTERAALERMIAKYGEEKMERLICGLHEIVCRPYAPRITSPYELEMKMGKLVQFLNQEKLKIAQSGTTKV